MSVKRLESLAQSFNYYVGLLIRRCYTPTYIGVDPKLDIHIRYLAIKMIYDSDLRKKEPFSLDENLLEEIEKKLTTETKQTIAQEVSDFKSYAALILKQAEDTTLPIPIEERALKHKLKDIRRKLRFHKEYFADMNAFKARVTYADIMKALSLISPIVLCGGLLKQYLLALFFKFDMGLVFTLGDYISSSLSTIAYALLPLFLMLVSGYWSFHENTRLNLRERRAARRQEDILKYVTYGIVVLSVGAMYFKQRDYFVSLLVVPGWILAGEALPRLFRRYFQNGAAVSA